MGKKDWRLNSKDFADFEIRQVIATAEGRRLTALVQLMSGQIAFHVDMGGPTLNTTLVTSSLTEAIDLYNE